MCSNSFSFLCSVTRLCELNFWPTSPCPVATQSSLGSRNECTRWAIRPSLSTSQHKTQPTSTLGCQICVIVYVYDCGNLFQELEGLLPVRSLKEALKVRALPHRDILGWVGAARWSPQNKKWAQSLLYDQQVLCLADLLQSNVESWMSQNQLWNSWIGAARALPIKCWIVYVLRSNLGQIWLCGQHCQASLKI